MFSKYFRGELLINSKRYAKSETTIQKALEERIPNHFLHVQFERKTSVSQSNLLYLSYGVYVYNYPKRQKMPKRVKMAPKSTTLLHTSFLITPMHSVRREKSICREQAYQSLSLVVKVGDVNCQLFPILGPPCILTGPNWHMYDLAMGPTI